MGLRQGITWTLALNKALKIHTILTDLDNLVEGWATIFDNAAARWPSNYNYIGKFSFLTKKIVIYMHIFRYMLSYHIQPPFKTPLAPQ